MRTSAKALSASGRLLSANLQAIVRQYESRFGKVPLWMLAELPPLRVTALLEAAVRVGIPYCVKDLDLMSQNLGD